MIYEIISKGDPHLMPLGVAHLLHDHGFRHPDAQGSEYANVLLMEREIYPAMFTDDTDSVAAALLDTAGVARLI